METNGIVLYKTKGAKLLVFCSYTYKNGIFREVQCVWGNRTNGTNKMLQF